MTKKGCCCGVTTPGYYNCCPPIGVNCVGKTINFQFEVTHRYFCPGKKPNSVDYFNDRGATYTCANGKKLPITNNPETWLITVSHTITQPTQVPITSGEFETPDDYINSSGGAWSFSNFACCPSVNVIGRDLASAYYDCLLNPSRPPPISFSGPQSEQGCLCATGPKSLCNFVPKERCEYYSLATIPPIDNIYLRCYSKYALLNSLYASTTKEVQQQRRQSTGEPLNPPIFDNICVWDYTKVPTTNYAAYWIYQFDRFAEFSVNSAPARVENYFKLGLDHNIAQNYSAQFIPNENYPEQLESTYEPITIPVIPFFSFRCDSLLLDPAVNVEPELVNLNNSSGFIHKIHVQLGFSYSKKFNCGTQSNPIIETLEIPFKVIEINDNIPLPIDYFEGENFNPNCFKDVINGIDPPNPWYEPCPPSKRYFYSAPVYYGNFSRQLQPSDKMTDCIPKSTQKVEYSSCKDPNDLSLIFYKDEYTNCDGWNVVGPPIDEFMQPYADQLIAQNYKWGSIETTDLDGNPTIIEGICNKEPYSSFVLYISSFWSKFSRRIDVF